MTIPDPSRKGVVQGETAGRNRKREWTAPAKDLSYGLVVDMAGTFASDIRNMGRSAVERPLLIVAHGAPSAPELQERALAGLAQRVGKHLPERRVLSATLAQAGALEAAAAESDTPIVYPHFMSDGWFVSTHLPQRLAAAGLREWVTTQPLGLFHGLPSLALSELRRLIDAQGLPAADCTLVIAAHGSPKEPRPAAVTREFARAIERAGLLKEVRVGFVDEKPGIEDAAAVFGPAVVLPFFAARAGHVLSDLLDALARARFKGPVMEPVGLWPAIPDLIAGAVRMHAMRRMARLSGDLLP